ncbi:hypothetical protein BaRGS_00010219, partial [Batillaria attramentaria]
MYRALFLLACALTFVAGAPRERAVMDDLSCNLAQCFVDPCMFTKCGPDTHCT